MSGPKDFTIDFSPLQLAVFAKQRDEQQAVFAARVQAARQTPRRRPAPRAPVENIVPEQAAVESSPLVEVDSKTSEESTRVATEFIEIRDAVEARRIALVEDTRLTAACADRYAIWSDRCLRIADLPASPEALREAHDTYTEGESLVADALDMLEKIERRRHVQQAIIDSFHATGFFTDIVNPGDTTDVTKPVTIVAKKGAEEVTVSLPLGDGAVQSRWAGQTDERCVGSFLDYVAQMGKRGMECRPERRDLADRPILRQAGRKELPRSRSEGG